MCSNNSNTFQCLNGGHCSEADTCICASACFVGNFCEIDYNAAHLPLTGAVIEDVPSSRDIYIAIFFLFGFIGLVNNILALMTFLRERIRITAYGVYLIVLSILSIILMLTILTYIITIVQYNNDTYKVAACHVIPFISLIMTDGGFLCTAAIAIERVFIECFDFSIHGSRIRGICVSSMIILYVAGSNIDEIFIRRISTDRTGRDVCIYDFDGYPTWRRFDIVFSYTHVIIPCVVHFVCSMCALTTIARRKIFIGSTEENFCRVWLQQLYLHRDFFIPPICLILCILPHGILGHLLKPCIPYSDKSKLRLHISFVLLLFAPQMLNFILYVYPNEIYFNEFQQTFLYRKLCCCYCYHRKRKSRQQKIMQTKNEQRKLSTCTISHESIGSGLSESIL